jgi:hypothetical protein
MERFIQKYEDKVIGILAGFDRLVLRGTLRALSVASGMMYFLGRMGVLLKDFGAYVEETTEQLKAASLEAARRLDRPIRYLPSSSIRKETIAREIAEADGVSEGLICVLTCVEPCVSYEIRRDKLNKKLVLEPRHRKCLHLYHYWIDPVFGFMHGRIQTWFPFTIQICINGREWLAGQMDRSGISYERRENCFVWIEDIKRGQELMDEMLRLSWPCLLDGIADRLNPAHHEILGRFREHYYWSAHQSEWATDILFESSSSLARIYPSLVRGAISAFSSKDVMRFLGKKPTGNFRGEVVSSYKRRPEGVRVKHYYKSNSVKVYNKQGSILRVETTINEPRDFRVYRRKEGDRDGPCYWLRMRKGIADLHRRAKVSDSSNRRYLDALGCLDTDTVLGKLVEPICRRRKWKGRMVRALRPWSADDSALLKAVSRGEFSINGFRNRDIVRVLVGSNFNSLKGHRNASGRVTRKLRLLRAHRIIRKVPHTNRYILTRAGRKITAAVLGMQGVTLQQLTKGAA